MRTNLVVCAIAVCTQVLSAADTPLVGVAARDGNLVGIVRPNSQELTIPGKLSETPVAVVGVVETPAVVIVAEPAPPVISVTVDEPEKTEARTGGVISVQIEDAGRVSDGMKVPGVAAKTPSVPVNAEWIDLPIPADALYPDGSGTLTISRATTPAASAIKNPWDIRVTPRIQTSEYKVIYRGGVFVPGSPVAFVNGLPLGPGEKVGKFNLAVIRTGEVVLESDGVFLVIPAGREVTIRIPQL